MKIGHTLPRYGDFGEVGLGPGDIVLNGDPSPPKGGGTAAPTFWPIYCGQTAGWIKMPLGTEVGIGPGHIVLDGDRASPKKEYSPHLIFGPCLLWPNGRPSQLLLSTCMSVHLASCGRNLTWPAMAKQIDDKAGLSLME